MSVTYAGPGDTCAVTVTVVRQQRGENGKRVGAALLIWCPGCDDVHRVSVRGDDGSRPPVEWTWDGNLDAPTVSPSIKLDGVQWPKKSGFHKPRHYVRAKQPICCHSFLERGVWRFLADCTHELVGQTAPMVPLPDWIVSP